MTTFYDLPVDLQRDIVRRKRIAEERDRDDADDDEWNKLIEKEMYNFADDFEVGKWGHIDRYYMWLKYKSTGRYFKLTIDDDVGIKTFMNDGMKIDKDKVLCRLFTNVWSALLWIHFSVDEIREKHFEMGLQMGNRYEVVKCLRDYRVLRKVMGVNHFCGLCRLIETIRENVNVDNDPSDNGYVPPYLQPDYWLVTGDCYFERFDE